MRDCWPVSVGEAVGRAGFIIVSPVSIGTDGGAVPFVSFVWPVSAGDLWGIADRAEFVLVWPVFTVADVPFVWSVSIGFEALGGSVGRVGFVLVWPVSIGTGGGAVLCVSFVWPAVVEVLEWSVSTGDFGGCVDRAGFVFVWSVFTGADEGAVGGAGGIVPFVWPVSAGGDALGGTAGSICWRYLSNQYLFDHCLLAVSVWPVLQVTDYFLKWMEWLSELV